MFSGNDLNAYSSGRTHHCGELTVNHIGQHVKLCGWIQYQRMGYFLTLRDAHGVTQCILPQVSTNEMSCISPVISAVNQFLLWRYHNLPKFVHTF